MAQEETILLHFDIDEQPAVNSIKDLRQANSQLRAERDKVNISTKEGKELVDKLNVAIDKNNKVIKDNSSALEKQRQNVGNYSKSIQEAAGNLNIMGTNVGALGTKLTSFANPATAAVAIVGALGAAYASSTIGARDLTFAQNQLAAATGIITNEFAALFSSAEDGEGALTGLFNSLLNALGPAGVALAAQSKGVALAGEVLEDLNREEIIARAEINERLSENAELLTKIQDSQTDYNEKVHLTSEVISNLRSNEEQILKIKNQQLASIDRQLSADQTNEKLLDERALKELEIAAIQRDTERKVGAIQRLESNLLDTYNKQAEALKKQREETERRIKSQDAADKKEFEARDVSFNDSSVAGEEFDIERDFLEKDKDAINDLLGLTISAEDQKRAELLRTNALKAELAEEDYQRNLEIAAGARDLTAALAAIAEEGSAAQQVLALTTIATNAAIGVSAAVKQGADVPFPANLAAILAGITAVLAGIAQAKSLLGFAEGGWTGPGSKYKAVGVVHADEYVAPKHIVHSPAAKPHIQALESMRLGQYYDGGFVANTNMQPAQQAMQMMNFVKNLPPIYTSWTEGRKVGKQVEFKERVTRQ